MGRDDAARRNAGSYVFMVRTCSPNRVTLLGACVCRVRVCVCVAVTATANVTVTGNVTVPVSVSISVVVSDILPVSCKRQLFSSQGMASIADKLGLSCGN